MNLNIKVIPGAKKNLLKKEGEIYKIYLTAPAVEGKANEALIEFLADYFQVRKSHVEIMQGLKSRRKFIRIN